MNVFSPGRGKLLGPAALTCERGCVASDAWRCAVAQRLVGQIACRCRCHRYVHEAMGGTRLFPTGEKGGEL